MDEADKDGPEPGDTSQEDWLKRNEPSFRPASSAPQPPRVDPDIPKPGGVVDNVLKTIGEVGAPVVAGFALADEAAEAVGKLRRVVGGKGREKEPEEPTPTTESAAKKDYSKLSVSQLQQNILRADLGSDELKGLREEKLRRVDVLANEYRNKAGGELSDNLEKRIREALGAATPAYYQTILERAQKTKFTPTEDAEMDALYNIVAADEFDRILQKIYLGAEKSQDPPVNKADPETIRTKAERVRKSRIESGVHVDNPIGSLGTLPPTMADWENSYPGFAAETDIKNAVANYYKETEEQQKIREAMLKMQTGTPGSRSGLDGDLSEAQKTFYGIPEKLPTTEDAWVDLARARLIKLRRLGESPYAQNTWPQNLEILLSLMPDYNGRKGEMVKKLLLEAKGFQVGYKVKGIVERLSKTTDGIKQLPNALEQAGASLTQDHLYNFKDMVETQVPGYLKKIFGDKDRVSMSVVMDRAMLLLAGYLGEWAEAEGKLLVMSEKAVVERVRKGDFRGDPKAWDKAVSDEFKNMKDTFLSETMLYLEAKYLDDLGFGNFGEGLAGEVLSQMFKSMPVELQKRVRLDKGNVANGEMGYGDIFDKAVAGDEVRLSDLFKRKNIFCEPASQLDRNYTEWLVGALAGAEYGEILAMDVVVGTTEATRLNTTEEAVAFESDNITHFYHPDVRQAGEVKKGAPTGSLHVAGRFPPVLASMLQGLKIDKKSILEHIRDGEKFTELDWSQIATEDPMAGFAAINLLRGMTTWGVITDTAADLSKELTEDQLRGLIKPLGTAWEDWGKNGSDDKRTLWDRREAWAASHLAGNNIKNFDLLGRDNWSPWMTLAVGWCYEHHPKSAILPKELASPLGVTPIRTEVRNRWIMGDEIYKQDSPGRYSVVNERATNVAYERFEHSQLLTPTEVRLVKAMVKAGR